MTADKAFSMTGSLSDVIMEIFNIFVMGLALVQLTSSVVPVCDFGWDHYQGNCYLVYPKTGNQYQYQEAKTTCESEHSHLVSITSQDEDDFVAERQVTLNNDAALWLGKKKADTIWADELPVTYSNYDETYVGECLAKYPSFWGHIWAAVDCRSYFGFMCKKALAEWTLWGAWSACDCGQRARETRARTCQEITSNRTSANCPGVAEERRACADSDTCFPASRAVGVVKVAQDLIYQLAPDWSVQVRTAMECARRCVGDHSCVSFSFHDDGTCEVFSHPPQTSTPTVSHQGASFWTIIERQWTLDN